MNLILNQIEDTLNKKDYDLYYEMLSNSPMGNKIDDIKKQEMIEKSIQQAIDYKNILYEEFGKKDAILYVTKLNSVINYVKEEANYSYQYLGFYKEKDHSIHINLTTINKIIKNTENYRLKGIETDKLRDTVIMHELFHHLEYLYPNSYTNEKHIDVKIFGLIKSKSNLSVISEIASVHFSKITMDLAHSPLIFNQIYNLK